MIVVGTVYNSCMIFQFNNNLKTHIMQSSELVLNIFMFLALLYCQKMVHRIQ